MQLPVTVMCLLTLLERGDIIMNHFSYQSVSRTHKNVWPKNPKMFKFTNSCHKLLVKLKKKVSLMPCTQIHTPEMIELVQLITEVFENSINANVECTL